MLYIPALRYTSLKVQYHKKIPLFSTFFSRIPANRTNRIVEGSGILYLCIVNQRG